MNILRTPTKAEGGITPEEKAKMDEISKKWIKVAFRTEPINKEKITDAIKRLYSVSGLKEPRIVIVPSPRVMAYAYGLSAGWWWLKKNKKITAGATRGATYGATRGATLGATLDATGGATKQNWLKELAVHFGQSEENANFLLSCIPRWWNNYQGGNMWAGFLSYAEAMRDVIGLTGLNCWEKYQAWEDAGREGGFRVMHDKFCIVSDFPERLEVDAQNRAHSVTGPSHRWRDGWEMYHLHGVKLDKEIWEGIVNRTTPLKDILKWGDIDKRTVALMVRGNDELFEVLKPKKIDECAVMRETGILEYELYEVTGITDQTEKMLRYKCASFDRTGKFYIKFVDPKYTSALEAIADSHHLSPEQYSLTIKQS
jgi:hypothetical protein